MDSNDKRETGYFEPPPLVSEETAVKVGLAGGLLASIAALLMFFDGMSDSATEKVIPARVILSVLGMIVAGSAISLRYRSPALWLIGAGASLIAGFGFPHSWDTFRLVAFVFSGVAAVGALLIALPMPWRMGVGTALVLFHFSGIFVAITIPPPSPRITFDLWARIYRPYLQFAYMGNAYQFYSPDPGPASELWFCIYYEPKKDDKVKMLVLKRTADGKPITDTSGALRYEPMVDADGELTGEPVFDSAGNFIFKEERDAFGNVLKKAVTEGDEGEYAYLQVTKWIKIPRRGQDFKDPLGQTYYRRLSLTEQVAQTTPLSEQPLDVQSAMTENRKKKINDFPFDPMDFNVGNQCRIPSWEIITQVTPSYVRYIARQNPDPAGRAISSIRVYRVTHMITYPDPFVGNKRNPAIGLMDSTTYLPYYLGDFDTKGVMMTPNDPMLYWLVPIRKNPNAKPEDFDKSKPMTLERYKRLYEDSVIKHSGSNHKVGELDK